MRIKGVGWKQRELAYWFIRTLV